MNYKGEVPENGVLTKFNPPSLLAFGEVAQNGKTLRAQVVCNRVFWCSFRSEVRLTDD
jgi:hypothetical protein